MLPVDPQAAFELLAAVFEADSKAMENCGDHDWAVACAFERPAEVMMVAAKRLPPTDVARRISALIEADSYGVRGCLALVIPA